MAYLVDRLCGAQACCVWKPSNYFGINTSHLDGQLSPKMPNFVRNYLVSNCQINKFLGGQFLGLWSGNAKFAMIDSWPSRFEYWLQYFIEHVLPAQARVPVSYCGWAEARFPIAVAGGLAVPKFLGCFLLPDDLLPSSRFFSHLKHRILNCEFGLPCFLDRKGFACESSFLKMFFNWHCVGDRKNSWQSHVPRNIEGSLTARSHPRVRAWRFCWIAYPKFWVLARGYVYVLCLANHTVCVRLHNSVSGVSSRFFQGFRCVDFFFYHTLFFRHRINRRIQYMEASLWKVESIDWWKVETSWWFAHV